MVPGKCRAALCCVVIALVLVACQSVRTAGPQRPQQPIPLAGEPPRVNSAIPAERASLIFEDRGAARRPGAVSRASAGKDGQPGEVTLKFADTDIREIARVILGTTLKLNYTIDPGVSGTATLETATPLARSELLPALEVLLNQNGATLARRGDLYAVVPIGAGEIGNVVAGPPGSGTGSQIVPLRYASAAELAKLLEPYVGEGGKLIADPVRNTLIVSGDAGGRETLLALVRAFDIDALAGQSFAILPTGGGDPEKVAAALAKALRAESDGPLSGLVQVIPLPRLDGVLVASSQPRYLDAARRFIRLTGRAEAASGRSWHVYYVQNGRSADLENLLQRAFTPRNVTASAPGTTAPGAETVTLPGGRGLETGMLGGPASGRGRTPGGLSGAAALAAIPGVAEAAQTGAAASRLPATEPLLATAPAGAEDESRMRIVANRSNNALLIYATASEYSVVERMLRKIDIVPLQVLVNATIAEVTLNDTLQYGTQFFFKVNGLAYTLGATPAFPPNALLPTGLVGFAVTHAPDFILRALSEVTQVKVLSAPQVLVMDNEPARLQVGQQVPILTASATSTLTPNAPIVNNIEYRPTGVIMQVIPRINSGGLVTLDIVQEVSSVSPPAPNTAVGSPTFEDRVVRTRVAARNGQTIALAGMIQDSVDDSNSGIPFLKEVPVLSTLFSFQSSRRARTELLVLITPQIVYDQRDAYALTEDLRSRFDAAALPAELSRKPIRGSANPHRL